MGQVREVKKSFCVLSAAYIVLGIMLLLWPDLSTRTFCYVFGVGMLILGGTHLILYFVKDRGQSVMQADMVIGVVGIATGVYTLLKTEYVLEIIPFALGIVAFLGCIVKLQHALDLRRIGSGHWYLMLIFALALFILGALLVANPFEELSMVTILIGVSLIVDGVGNLLGIFWIGLFLRHINKINRQAAKFDLRKAEDAVFDDGEAAWQETSITPASKDAAMPVPASDAQGRVGKTDAQGRAGKTDVQADGGQS